MTDAENKGNEKNGTSAIPKAARVIRKVVSTALIVGATYAFFKYDVNNKINNMINQVRGYGTYVAEDTQQKVYNATHTDPREVLPKFEAAIHDYETQVRNGSFDDALTRYQTVIDSVRSGEATAQYIVDKNKEAFDLLRDKVTPEQLDEIVDGVETILRTYQTAEHQHASKVKTAFEAVEYLNGDGLVALRSYAQSQIPSEQSFQLDLEGIAAAPKDLRMYAVRQVCSTLTPDDQVTVVSGIVGEAQERERFAQALSPYVFSPMPFAQPAVAQQETSGHVLGSELAYTTSGQSPFTNTPLTTQQPSYLSRLGQRVQATIKGILP